MGMYGGDTAIQAPAAPNYQESMRDILKAQVEMAPEVYAREAEYQPKYAQLQANVQGYLGEQALRQAAQMYPQVAQIEAGYNAANRAAELQQLQSTLPQYQQAFAALTPGYQEALGSTGALAQQSMRQALQRPELTAFEQGVAGPQAGQQIGAIQGPMAGDIVGAVQGPRVGGFVGGVRGPQMQSGLNQINQGTVQQYLNTMPGAQDYANFLAQSSAQELSAGKSLTPEEQRLADQSARSAFAARGTALGGQAVNAEILNRASVQNQRYQQRLANAQQAAGTIQSIYQPALAQSLQRQQAGLEYGLGAQQQAFGQALSREQLGFGAQQAAFEQAMNRENLRSATQQTAFGQALSREQLGMGVQETAFQQALQRGQAEQQRLRGATEIQAGQAQLGAGAMGQLQAAQAPVLQAFYKQPILQGQVGGAQQMGMNMGQAAGPQLFNPESQTGMGSIYGAYNSQMNLAGAQAQANAAKSAGQAQMTGQIAGAAATAASAAFCWVAREVYGEANPAWKIFREWMIEDSPRWFHNLYCKYGERFAQFISNKPKLKRLVKAWMDSKIS